MIKINNLVKKYGGFTALNRINLDIPNGSVYGFVGPNGAGKTTTIKIIAGLLKSDEGDVFINDEKLNKALISEKIGYMPDFFGVYSDLKVKEYMDFYAGAYYIPYADREKIIFELLDLVNLNDKKDIYVDTLSRGMKQKLCLARCMVHNPDILLLDEPASGLDPRARIEFKEIIKYIKSKGKTVIISSHILPELSEMCSDIAVFDRGKIVMSGNINKINEQLTDGKTVSVKTMGSPDKVLNFLKKYDCISNAETDNDTVIFKFKGNEKEQYEILKALVNNDINVLEFTCKPETLENIFMQITGGKGNA